MFKRLRGLFSSDLSIDLGTANTLIYVRGRGIVLDEPSVVAIRQSGNMRSVASVGADAKRMLGRTPGNITAIRPMKDGVIADFTVTEQMLQHFIRKVHQSTFLTPSPRVLVCVPCMSTQVERRAIRESAEGAGAREVFLIEEPMAAAIGAGLPVEEAQGSMVVDIGGGTTDMAIFTEGAIRHTAVIPIAGDQVTNDIAMALRTPTQHAEEIKVKYACALTQLAASDEMIKVPSVGDRPARDLSRQALAEVVEPRYEELFTLVRDELRRSGYEDMVAAGVVLTGGTSRMEGVSELAEEIFHMPVRIACPQNVRGLADVVRNPIYATGVGLLHYALQETRHGQGLESHGGVVAAHKGRNELARRDIKDGHSALARIKGWFKGNF